MFKRLKHIVVPSKNKSLQVTPARLKAYTGLLSGVLLVVGAKGPCVCREAGRGVTCNRVFESALYIIIRSLLKFVYVLQWLRTCWNKLLPA